MEFMREGDSIDPGNEPLLAPGVRGCAFDTADGIYIPIVIAEAAGNGDVSRFLDSLSVDRRFVFPNVISTRLLGMLKRRGFVAGWESGVEIWERGAR